MLATVLAGERDGVEERDFGLFHPPKRAPLCGFTTLARCTPCVSCTHRALKTLQIAGLGLLASRELTEQDSIIENSTPFSTHSPSTVYAATIVSSSVQTSSRRGNMYPCCFGPMLVALHARLSVVKIERPVGNKGLNIELKHQIHSQAWTTRY